MNNTDKRTRAGKFLLAFGTILILIFTLALSVKTTEGAEDCRLALAEEALYNVNALEVREGYIDYNAATSVHEEKSPLLASSDGKRYIYNLVIYICFSDESTEYAALGGNPCYQMLSGEENSLADYYKKESYGKVVITSLYPQSGTAVAVYQDSRTRASRQKGSSDPTRASTEKSILQGALDAVGGSFKLAGVDLDANDDGYVDAVSFLISKSSSDSWGSLLWPHSWNLETIGGSYSFGNVKVGDYSFNFVDSLTLGVTCHEFFHVLGAPDLYHYDYDFVPVGYWDLMQFDQAMPQYSLVYMRDKYLDVIDDRQIATVTHNGVYSLSPVTTASEDEIIAYKIPTDKSDETIWVEYRNPSLSGGSYDSTLPGAGLVIYRIKDGVKEGNRNANYKSLTKPDEVYVYRPQVSAIGKNDTKTQQYNKSRTDISYSYLSPENSRFSSVGATIADKPTTNASSRYDYTTIYYVDGTNTGIIIEALTISDGSIEFSVKLNKGNEVDESYFNGKISFENVFFNDTTEFSGISSEVVISDSLDVTYIGGMEVELLDKNGDVMATNTLSVGKFQSESLTNGEKRFKCRFVVNDRGNALLSVFDSGSLSFDKTPKSLRMVLTDVDGDVIYPATSTIDSGGTSWNIILATKDGDPHVIVGDKATYGIKYDGSVVSANPSINLSGMTGIKQVALGYSHTLFLSRETGRVTSKSDKNIYRENDVDGWRNVIMIAAGRYTSYALSSSGKAITVLATGNNDVGQLEVSKWSDETDNVVYIAAGDNFVIGITEKGNVLAAGGNDFGQIEKPTITKSRYPISVTCGRTFAAYLMSDGTVEVKGTLASKSTVASWSGITKISAGSSILLGLKDDGTVVGVGDNSYGQLKGLDEFIDIIDLGAGDRHTAFLRMDGFVEYRGRGYDEYSTNGELPNLCFENYIPISNITMSVDTVPLYDGHIVYGDTQGIHAYVGNRITIHTGIEPQTSTYKRLIFSSSNPRIVSVLSSAMSVEGDNYCDICCLAPGEVTIYAEAYGGAVVCGLTIIVTEYVALENIAAGPVTMVIGSSLQVPSVFNPTDAAIVEWEFQCVGGADEELIDGVSIDAAGLIYITAGSFNKGNTVINFRATNIITKAVINYALSVEVISGIVNMAWDGTAPESLRVRYGESPDLSDYKIKITWKDNDDAEQTTVMSIPEAMVVYNPCPNMGGAISASNNITIDAFGEKSLTIIATTYDYITVAQIVKMIKGETEYTGAIPFEYGEKYDGVAVLLKLTYRSGRTGELRNAFPEELIRDSYNPEVPGIYEIGVKVSNLDVVGGVEYLYSTFEVQVFDVVASIEIGPHPKTVYSFGEELDTHEVVYLNMKSGALRQAEICDQDFTYTAHDSKKIGKQNINISYTDPVSGDKFSSGYQVTVDSTMSFEFGGFYLDEDVPSSGESKVNYIYYYIGEDLPITVQALVGKSIFTVGTEKDKKDGKLTDNLYYDVRNGDDPSKDFDNTKPSVGTVIITIYVVNLSGWQELYTRKFNVFGVKKEFTKSLVGLGSEYQYGTPITGAQLSIVYEDQQTGTYTFSQDEYIYDPELVDEQQILSFRYQNGILAETKVITIYNYVKDVKLQGIGANNTITTVYGVDFKLDVYVEMAKGDARKVPLKKGDADGYTMSAYSILDPLKIDTQQLVTITYNDGKSDHTASFILVVVDEIVNVELENSLQSTFKYGTDFSAVSEYKLTYKSKRTTVIGYNSDDFSLMVAPNMTKLGKQVVIVRFVPLNMEFTFTINVVNYVVALDVEKSYKSEYKYGEDLDIKLVATYADGSKANITAKDCQAPAYNSTPTFKGSSKATQDVTVSYGDFYGTASVKIKVTVSDQVTSLAWDTAPGYTSFKYGEAISFPGAILRISYLTATAETVKGRAILENPELSISYNPTKEGKQSVSVSKEGVSVSFTVSVEKRSDKTLQFNERDDLLMNKDETVLISGGTMTLAALASEFVAADYLTVTIQDAEGKILSVTEDVIVKTGYHVKILNANNQAVFDYKFVLRGDTNCDGELTPADIGALASMYVSGEYDKNVADYDGDGVFSLTDIVSHARKATDNTKPPVNQMAKGFITDVKCRKQKEENAYENA